MIFPNAMLGMLGGGQLGRMFTLAAHSMGYRVAVLDPDPSSPAGTIADVHIRADYMDEVGLQALAKSCAAVTTEFENVPAQSLDYLAKHCIVSPVAQAVAITQDRISEKRFLQGNGFKLAPFAVIEKTDDLRHIDLTLLPGILKRSRFGYDGKGQERVDTAEQIAAAFANMGHVPCVLERLIPLQLEISVVAARSHEGKTITYEPAENQHRNGILDISIVPARAGLLLKQQAQQAAAQIAEKLNYCGVLAVEFFISQNELLVNEIAPRPHNSGHYTIDACVTSQFEQQVRTLCHLPLGSVRLLNPVVMVNLLGDSWQEGEPLWEEVFSHPEAKLHLYGKHEARVGRKMGHYTCLGATAEEALLAAEAIRERLTIHQLGNKKSARI